MIIKSNETGDTFFATDVQNIELGVQFYSVHQLKVNVKIVEVID